MSIPNKCLILGTQPATNLTETVPNLTNCEKLTVFFSFSGDLVDKELCLPVQEMQVQSLSWDDPRGKELATHSSILAWKIP